ncbi:MAG: DUF2147 domain-containing protein [Hyphomicrobiales bacterium]|nr:DUF2147 domain-containing protein [Hyphomicrobiales bacterium]
MRTKAFGPLAVILFIVGAGGPASADPKGLWVAEDHAQVRIADCSRRSQALCATVAAARSSVDPETGRPWTDKHNPDPKARGRSLIGVYVLYNMLPDGPGKWSGTLYNTDDGHTYPGHLLETGPRTIRIEGCAIGICGGRNLTRVR